MIEQWAGGRMLPTLDTLCVQLWAVREGMTAGNTPVREFMSKHFTPNYAEMVAGRELENSLNHIRETFRNRATHDPPKSFTPGEYEQFADLVTARSSFNEWNELGPNPCPPEPARGTLYHHLANAKGV